MTTHSPDVAYAYAQLGLAFGASSGEIEAVLAHAKAYQYSTASRIHGVERFVDFFRARDQLGDINTPFAFIRRAYHKKALMLHPDRNQGNRAAEEQLKIINAAFAIIDAIHREARDYYRQNEIVREAIEEETRETTDRETPPEVTEAVAAAVPVSERTKLKEPFDPLRIVWLPLAMFCSIILAVVPSRRKR